MPLVLGGAEEGDGRRLRAVSEVLEGRRLDGHMTRHRLPLEGLDYPLRRRDLLVPVPAPVLACARPRAEEPPVAADQTSILSTTVVI